MELLHNEEELCCNPPLPKLDIISARQKSHGFIFSGDIPVDVQLVTFFLPSIVNAGKLTIGDKLKNFDSHDHL